MARDPGHDRHLLLLTGAAEGRQVAAALANLPGWRVTASQHETDRVHGPLPVETRLGGFGGEAAFRDFLRARAVDAVLDATHPFAHRMSARSARVCAEIGLPYLQVLRPAWQVDAPACIPVADEAAAATRIGAQERVFITTGRASLAAFAGLDPAQLYVRQIRPGPLPQGFEAAHQIIGAGPFSVADEVATFRRYRIDVLVARNSGGTINRSKLDAAAQLGLRVLLIDRPPQPDARRVETACAALDWVARL